MTLHRMITYRLAKVLKEEGTLEYVWVKWKSNAGKSKRAKMRLHVVSPSRTEVMLVDGEPIPARDYARIRMRILKLKTDYEKMRWKKAQ